MSDAIRQAAEARRSERDRPIGGRQAQEEEMSNAIRSCLECLRTPCQCKQFPGTRVPDELLIDFATTCSGRGLRLHAEIILRQRYPSRKWRGGARK